MPSISANQLVSATPSVLSAGGRAMDLNGVIVTSNSRVPTGSILEFPNDGVSVTNFFGYGSDEASLASTYFLGFTNSSMKPGLLLFAQYNNAPVGAWLRGSNIAYYTLNQLQSINGTLNLVVDGIAHGTSFSLSGVTSFSAAASVLQNSLLNAGFTGLSVTFDSVAGGFYIASPSTGVGSTIEFALGTGADNLGLTSQAGATRSQGANATTPAAIMGSIASKTANWAAFMTTFEPLASDKIAFANWVNSTNDRYVYVCWDTDASPTTGIAPSSVGATLMAADTSGTFMVYKDRTVAAFVLGLIASVNFTELNGRTTFAYRGQTGITPTVTDGTIAQNLKLNGYNFLGAYATAADNFQFLQNGQITGPFQWADSYINQIWMLNAFQLAVIVAFQQSKSIPYNIDGYSIIQAALLDPIRAAVDFGAIRAGVTLSEFQIANINSDAGAQIDDVISRRGWYLKVFDASPQVRQARKSPPCKFWYADGQSIQELNINSIEIQ